MENGMPILKLVQILDALRVAAPDATVELYSTMNGGVLRVNYNGPTYLDIGPRAAELFGDADVSLCDGYAEVPVP